MLLGAGAAIAGAALYSPGAVSADNGDDDGLFRPQPLPQPQPILGILAPDAPIHVFAPGPDNITLPLSHGTLQGLDVEPSVITDYRGFTALVYPVGTARGSDGKPYDFEGDMRLFSGTYKPADGSALRSGAFALV
ncbi:MAG TPA: hypothetical protein VGJ60_36175 [Chloroflexota bacterium]|jgi:hypothetical protein